MEMLFVRLSHDVEVTIEHPRLRRRINKYFFIRCHILLRLWWYLWRLSNARSNLSLRLFLIRSLAHLLIEFLSFLC